MFKAFKFINIKFSPSKLNNFKKEVVALPAPKISTSSPLYYKSNILNFTIKYTLSLLTLGIIVAAITHSRVSIADGNKTKEQIAHVQFTRLSLKAKVNITHAKIKQSFKDVPSYKKLNRQILYESNSIVNSVIGWNAGPIDGGKTFYISLPTTNDKVCAKDKIDVSSLPQVKRIDCRPGKMFVIFNEEKK